MKRIIVLLPSAINFGDRSSRLNETIKTISFYAKRFPQYEYIFCDNTGEDLNGILDESINCNVNITYLSFKQESYDVNDRSGGYGEINCIDYALKHIEGASNRDIILKINARYQLLNLDKIIEYIRNNDAVVYGNLRQYGTWMDSRVFAANIDFFENFFLEGKEKISNKKSFYFENILARSVHKLLSEGLKWLPWAFAPRIRGVSNATKRKYSTHGLRYMLKIIYHHYYNKLIK